jgi:transcriptional regulator with AAA-type ATPase domain
MQDPGMSERILIVGGDAVDRERPERMVRQCGYEPALAAAEPAADAGSLAPPLLAAEATAAAPAGTLALLDGSGQMRALEDIEAEAIRFAITHYGGRMSEVARRLRIGRSTLYRKLDSLGRDAAISDPKTPAW